MGQTGSNSLAEAIASLDVTERNKRIEELTDTQIDSLLWDWEFWARPKQKPPQWDWLVWLVLAGRGFGKTRVGAEMVRRWKEDFPIIHLIGPTAADVRDVMVRGPAGLMKVCPPWDRPKYEPSKRCATFENGSQVLLFSADEPERLRGPQCYKAWADEPAAWRYADAWDQMMFGLRLGAKPQVVATTTPKPISLIKDLVKRDGIDVHVTRGSTKENIANLAEVFIGTVIRKYEGTRLGRQELEAELLEDTEGALWTARMIDHARQRSLPPLDAVCIAVDPPAADPKTDQMGEADKLLNAECGIIAVGRVNEVVHSSVNIRLPHGYVIADYSIIGYPEEWAREVVEAYHTEGAHLVVAEANNGGAMVRSVIHQIDPNIPVTLVHASQSKRTRAEPVSAMYEQGRIHHIGYFPELESQMTTWIPGMKSPDRMDAMVWGFWRLMIGAKRSVGRLASKH